MLSRYKFVDSENSLYFLTFTVIEKIPVFTNSKYCDVIIENFEFYRQKQGLVSEDKDWYYSSARNLYGLESPFKVDVLDDNWGMEDYED